MTSNDILRVAPEFLQSSDTVLWTFAYFEIQQFKKSVSIREVRKMCFVLRNWFTCFESDSILKSNNVEIETTFNMLP